MGCDVSCNYFHMTFPDLMTQYLFCCLCEEYHVDFYIGIPLHSVGEPIPPQ